MDETKQESSRENVGNAGVLEENTSKKEENIPVLAPAVYEEDAAVSVAQAMKALAYLFAADQAFSIEETEEKWYQKYLVYLQDCGIWKDLDLAFGAVDQIAVTGEMQRRLLRDCEAWIGEEKGTELNALCEDTEVAVSQKDWWVFYQALAKAFACEERISYVSFSVYATEQQQEMLKGQIYTDLGVIRCEGLILRRYVDCRMQGAMIGTELLWCFPLREEPVTYQNVYLLETDADTLVFFYGGMTKHYDLSGSGLRLPTLSPNARIADVVLEKGKPISLRIKADIVTDRPLCIREDGIYFEESGFIPYASGFALYKQGEELQTGTIRDILPGYCLQEFVRDSGMLVAAVPLFSADTLPTEKSDMFVPDLIRVLIKTNGFADVYHETLQILGEQGSEIIWGNVTLHMTEDEEIRVGRQEDGTMWLEIPGRGKWYQEAGEELPIYLIPLGDGTLTVASLQRGYGTPVYRGRLEIWNREGGLHLINELPFETYLTRVVPSEMPTSYGLECAKVQAVCARSYAYQQMQAGKYQAWGAHVDDSTSFQVYNNSTYSEVSAQGVKETAGEVLLWGSQVLTAYYYSTSAGVTTDAEIWNEHPEYSPFLWSHFVTTEAEQEAVNRTETESVKALRAEEVFRAFIMQPQEDSLEKNFPWYRWSCELTYAELTARIQAGLAARSRNNPSLTLVLQEDGSYQGAYIERIGEVLELQVLERSSGGIVSKLLVRGTEATVILCKQSNIRTLLGDASEVYTNQERGGITGKSSLPSAFFCLEETEGGYRVYGGGIGHGLGMSQNGAKVLADQGWRYDRILQYFYRGAEIMSYYEDFK